MIKNPPVIVVGITPGHPEVTVRRAADLARGLGAEMVFAVVDGGERTAREAGGADPVAPETGRAGRSVQMLAVHETLERLLTGQPVPWRVEQLGGDPIRELARLAERLDAVMIAVGTRQAGIRGRVSDFFTGSLAAQLAHHQPRPVLVVPTAPVGFEQATPWE